MKNGEEHSRETLEEKIARVVRERVTVEPWDPRWPELFDAERRHLRECLPRELLGRIEHFGGTAVPGLPAKPIIDILVEVRSLEETKRRIAPVLEAQGYDYFWRPTRGDDTPPFYAWFIKRNERGERTHHIHMVEPDFEHWDRLLFRDWLIDHPGVAAACGRLKTRLAREHGDDRVAYTAAKTAFIGKVTEEAVRAVAVHRFLTRPSGLGEFAVVWRETGQRTAVLRILLPGPRLREAVAERYPDARIAQRPAVVRLAEDIGAVMSGEAVELSLDRVAIDLLGDFQRRVLAAEHGIPRGRVSSYGRIAARVGSPGGARAVGRALATNPFPIVVPCHRAIRSDGGLGGFQGGAEMKRILLEREGVAVSPAGRVASPRWHYRHEDGVLETGEQGDTWNAGGDREER